MNHILVPISSRISGKAVPPSCGPARFFEPASGIVRGLKKALVSLALLAAIPQHAVGATLVNNTAKASYTVGVTATTSFSNAVSTVVRTPAKIEFLEYAPANPGATALNVATTSYQQSGGAFAALPAPTPLGSATPIDLTAPVYLVPTKTYHVGEPVFIRLTDLDQNLDPAVAETVVVTLTISALGETEVLRLTETGPNTGIFTGYIQSGQGAGVPANGSLQLTNDSKIVSSYTDVLDGTDAVQAATMVDPYGIVFDSSTGLPKNGAAVTFINTVTGSPATVYGDDGVSIFPSTVTTGGTATDSSGKVYTFPPGGFRFPYVLPGTYRFAVTTPAGYHVPSVAQTTEIQGLPGAPFAIETGSRLEDFIINPGPALHIDIPADPSSSALYLTKKAGKSTAAPGDFIQYRIGIENTATSDVKNIVVNDKMPLGFRYRKGSAKIGSATSPDPTISEDGRTFLFNVGTVAGGKTTEISYVVEVAVGAKTGKADNFAHAAGSGGVSSNTAKATVQVIEDLFGSKSAIMGRVFPKGCGEPQDIDGVAGVRIYLEDGNYVVTDKKGMYHFAEVRPGTHVVQIDLTTIPDDYELVPCEDNNRFAGTLFSQFVDLQGGTMWRADFYLAPKPKAPPVEVTGTVGIELRSEIKDSEVGENQAIRQIVDYELSLHVGDVPAKNLRISVILPEGVVYKKGSSVFAGAALPDPEIMDSVLTYRISEEKEGWHGMIRFSASVALEGKGGDLTTKAILTFDSPSAKNQRTPAVDNILKIKLGEERTPKPDITLHPHFDVIKADLKKEDKDVLDGIISGLKKSRVISIHVTGHTDSQHIAKRSRKIFADNYALSKARAKSVADYLAAGLGLSPDQVTADGKGPDIPVAENKTEKGRARNRRVELKIVAENVVRWNDLANEKEKSGLMEVAIKTVKGVEPSPLEKENEEKTKAKTMPEFDNAWLGKAEPGLAFVCPLEGYHPPIPSLKIAVKHDPGKKLRLLMNGEDVDPVFLDGTIKRSDNRVAVSQWMGVHLLDGDNFFDAVEQNEDGSEGAHIKRTIHYSTSPVRARIVADKSRTTADGKTPPVIAVLLTDKDGHPAREGLIGEYKLLPPYIPLQKTDNLQNDPLTISKAETLKYTVGEDGIALIAIQPTSKTGEVVLKFNLVSGENEVRTWLTPGDRDWIFVGLAEGTAGYNTISGNMESAGDSDAKDGYYKDGRLAFFAKGRIKGEWLLTAAYDTEKNKTDRYNSLFGTIDPNRYYNLYGDATAQQSDSPSARSLYLKIERDRFYALFGDYATDMTVTELSRYSRSFNGLKSEMKGETIDFNVFAADTNQAFVKDEIRGDGTSGLYRLSRKNIIMNSESITIEVRDRFHSEVIVSSHKLSNFIDYSIDYEAGTIFFKSPVYSRDENFNPIWIVVNYESYDSSDTSYNYGGRGAVRVLDNKIEIGATHVHEGRVGGEGNLYGADATVKLDEKTRIKAEVAETKTEFGSASTSGNAYLTELSHTSDKVQGKVYVREQGTGFGLGQQNGSESGTRKLGLDGTYRLNENVSVRSEIYRQYNLSTDAQREVAQAQGMYSEKEYEVHGGLRHAQDTMGNGDINTSEQLTTGASYRMLKDTLTLRIDHDQSIMSNNSNSDFPTRTTMGADYKLNDTATLFVAHEITQGANADTQTTRIGMKASPWTGGQVSSSIEQQATENGTRVFAVNGLKQTWQVTRKFSLDAGLDRSETLRHPGNSSLNTNVPAASGGTDFTAVSLGAGYKEEKWGWTGRVEKRDSEAEDKVGVFTGVYGEVREGLGLSAALMTFRTEASTGTKKTSGDLRFGLAYRPKDTAWIVLDRFDYIFEEQKGGSSNYDNQRFVNNVNVNWRIERRAQLSMQYGSKYVRETIDELDYSGYTDLTGLEGRYDITKKWDVGIRGNMLHSWDAEQYKYGYGPSVGYNAAKNVWISVGYNIEGFKDRDFSKADFTAAGPYVKLRMKFDQESVKDAVKGFTGQ